MVTERCNLMLLGGSLIEWWAKPCLSEKDYFSEAVFITYFNILTDIFNAYIFIKNFLKIIM
jgi:hypothetical protein